MRGSVIMSSDRVIEREGRDWGAGLGYPVLTYVRSLKIFIESILYLQVTEVASASSVSWVLCCAIALGSPVALVGIIILAFNKDSLQTDQNKIKNTTKPEPESSTQDLNPENVRYRRHLGVVPTLWTGTIGPVQTV